MVSPEDVLDFWLGEHGRDDWFGKDPAFDAAIAARFADAIHAGRAGAFDDWMANADNCLALVVLLDQMARNAWRGAAEAYAGDAKALAVARHALASGYGADWPYDRRFWFYMPLMHSEDLACQDECVDLVAAHRDGSELIERSHQSAQRHREIIARFGRFPHRNAVLGRASTDAEIAFLNEPDSSF